MKSVTPLVQNVKTTQMKNSGRGIEVSLRFPLEGNSELALMLMEQQGNPITVQFSDPIQARLPAAPRDEAEAPAVETTTMSVNGVDSPVTRPSRRNGNKADGKNDTAYPAHAFVESEDHPGLCKVCNYRPEAGVHADESERPLPHPFGKQDKSDQCASCGLAESHWLHQKAATTDEAPQEAESPLVASLLDGAQEPETAPVEA